MIEINKSTNFEIADNFFKVSTLIYPEHKILQDNPLEINALFSELNPFFRDGQVAYELEEDKARCMIFIGPNVTYKGKPAAYFGYFESINDTEVVQRLFKKCEKWVKDKGISTIIGPINFNTYHRYRLNLDQENQTPFLNEPQNPTYYPTLIEEAGYKVLNNYLSYNIYSQDKLKEWYATYSAKKDILGFDQYEFIKITPDVWMDKLEEIHKKSELVFGDNFSYTPIDLETFKIKYGQFFSNLICPHTSLFALFNGEIVGTTINFPNYYELLSKGFGFNEIDIETYFKESKSPTLLLKTVGMMKEHANMGFLMIRMMLEIAPAAFDKYSQYVCCLMQEGNYPAVLAKEFSDHTKKYALYIKEL